MAGMAVKVYLGTASAAQGEITYDQADAFSVTAAGFLLIQRHHSGGKLPLSTRYPFFVCRYHLEGSGAIGARVAANPHFS